MRRIKERKDSRKTGKLRRIEERRDSRKKERRDSMKDSRRVEEDSSRVRERWNSYSRKEGIPGEFMNEGEE